ncbi:MAG: Holliday junction branch migration protein RuvA [Methanomassiliicoccales archaeon]
MLDYMSGVLVQANPESIVMEVMGLGIKAFIPPGSAASFGRLGEKISAYTQMQVLENELRLFAFASAVEQELFVLLLTVSGLGSRTALNVLSTLSVAEFYQSVITGDEKTLTRVPGIGKKVAQRIIFELADKVGKIIPSGNTTDMEITHNEPMVDEMMSALMALGYSQREVLPRLNIFQKEGQLTGVIGQDLRLFLKSLDSGKKERI